MRIPGLKTAKAFSRWMRARLHGGAIILGYHCIADKTTDGHEVSVSPEHFAEHMDVICKYAYPIRLSKLVQHLKEDSLPLRSVAVTFDDGYADNLYVAKPILAKYDIPATVFVCTGYAGKEFWWDELERLIMKAQAELYSLHLQVGTSRFQWNHSLVRPKPDTPGEALLRKRFYQELYYFLLELDIDDQRNALDVIRNWSGLSSNGISTLRALDHHELLQLADGGLVELGAHTRNHLVLPRLSLERQRDEIIASKRDLEVLLDRAVNGFAYPNGNVTEDAKRIVRKAGFVYACTSPHDVVRPGSDLYEMPRFWQKDVDGDKFLQGLRRWMIM